MSIRAKSVPVDEVTARARKAAEHVIADRIEVLGGGRVEIGVFPDIGTVGLIWRDMDLDRLNMREVYEMSAKITDAMGPVAEGASPTVQIFKDFGTMGYFPSGPIQFDTLR
ncbi:hypothetical protein [Aestuariivita sp.]|uniref:hypothetical protein n=1 Tax=Aestuariivita sp. TaxID=1872407 RepID=UPI00216B9162|nr:hypothetical protein [Aestuariivita sp.]MCE8008884.1 hypothetical protein [Aestuariivita sp.]